MKGNIESICEIYDITNYTINDDDSIDVNQDVYLQNRELVKLPLIFRNVIGYFDCSSNRLKSLEGSPESVGGDFDCSHNELTSLEGSPYSVYNFYCEDNQLTSLKGSPESVGGFFNCKKNQLTSLEGSPKSVGGDFLCDVYLTEEEEEESRILEQSESKLTETLYYVVGSIFVFGVICISESFWSAREITHKAYQILKIVYSVTIIILVTSMILVKNKKVSNKLSNYYYRVVLVSFFSFFFGPFVIAFIVVTPKVIINLISSIISFWKEFILIF